MSKIKIEKPTREKLNDLDVDSWSKWECEPSTFDWEYDCDETAYVLEGMGEAEAEQLATRVALVVVLVFIALGGLILMFVRENETFPADAKARPAE